MAVPGRVLGHGREAEIPLPVEGAPGPPGQRGESFGAWRVQLAGVVESPLNRHPVADAEPLDATMEDVAGPPGQAIAADLLIRRVEDAEVDGGGMGRDHGDVEAGPVRSHPERLGRPWSRG